MTARGGMALMMLLLLSVAAKAQSTALDDGVRLFRQGQFGEALVKLEEAHRAAPRDASIENLIGITETRLGHIADADLHYRAAIRLDSTLPAPHRNLGFNWLTAGDYARAKPELEEASRLDPADPFAHYYLLQLALATKHDADAVEEAALAGHLVENDPETVAALIQAQIRQGQADAARTEVVQMEAAGRLSLEREYRIALLFIQHGFYSQAADCFRHIANADPSWQNRYNLAVALLYENRPADASALLAVLHKEQPGNAEILMYLGTAWEMQQRMPEALDAYREALADDPSNPDRVLDYTRLLMDTDRYDEAIQVIQSAMGKSDAAAPLQLRLGAIEMVQAHYAAARADFEAALKAAPGLDVAYVGLAQTYARENNDPEALKILRQARDQRPDDYLLEYYVGLVAGRMARLPEAIAALRKAARLQPESPDPFFELGKLYEGQQNWAEARTALERVVRLNPGAVPAHFQLCRVYEHLDLNSLATQEAQRTRVLVDEQRDAVLRRQRERGASFQPQVGAAPAQ